MTKKERIIDKIRKTLALSENNTFMEEAHTAMLKAQELMAKYDISMAEVEASGDKTKDKDVIIVDLTEWGRTPYWKKALAKIIGENFRCMSYTTTGGGRSKIRVLGLEEDAQIAKEMFEFAVNALEYSVKDYMRKSGGGAGVKNDYIIGFTNGLRDKFAEQVEKNNWGLVLVKDALVEQKIAEMNFTRAPASQIQRNRSHEAYSNGYSRGKSLQKHKELAGR